MPVDDILPAQFVCHVTESKGPDTVIIAEGIGIVRAIMERKNRV